MKKTFCPTTAKGRLPAVAYTPLMFMAGTQVHQLALHKEINRAIPDELKTWFVSEPVTGRYVCHAAPKGLTLRQAREAAMATLGALCERIGSDQFNAVIQQAKEQV